eukprot:465167-Rhodomonas_salina.4
MIVTSPKLPLSVSLCAHLLDDEGRRLRLGPVAHPSPVTIAGEGPLASTAETVVLGVGREGQVAEVLRAGVGMRAPASLVVRHLPESADTSFAAFL